MKPIIFLSFANDRKNPNRFLDQLEPEKNTLQRILSGLSDKGWGQFYAAGSSDPKEILRDLQDRSGRIIIFHFSGHASGTSLILDSLDKGKVSLSGSSLTSFLEGEEQLKLVVLNACATRGHVKALFEIGIQAVIATDKNVGDENARDFSEAFYRDLVNGSPLQIAFNKAKSAIEPSGSLSRTYRRDVIEEVEDGDMDGSSWGLFYQDEEVLNWSLKPETMEPLEKIKQLKERVAEREDWDYILHEVKAICEANPILKKKLGDIILLSGRINALKREFDGEMIDNRDYRVSKNRLSQALLSLLEDIEKRLKRGW